MTVRGLIPDGGGCIPVMAMGLSGLSLVSFVFGAPLGSGTAFFSFSSSFSFLSSTISTGAAEPAAPSSEPAAEPTARLASSSSLPVS